MGTPTACVCVGVLSRVWSDQIGPQSVWPSSDWSVTSTSLYLSGRVGWGLSGSGAGACFVRSEPMSSRTALGVGAGTGVLTPGASEPLVFRALALGCPWLNAWATLPRAAEAGRRDWGRVPIGGEWRSPRNTALLWGPAPLPLNPGSRFQTWGD